MRRNKPQISPANLVWQGKRLSGVLVPKGLVAKERISSLPNRLFCGENRDVMLSLLKEGYAGEVNLIYIDPPFGTGSNLHFAGDADNYHLAENKAYADTWENGLDSYLQMMYERLFLMRELLARNGSIYVHLDYHVAHYIKVLLDELFGRDNMVNQIIWQRTGAHNDPQAFGRNYDIILLYQKSTARIWNRPLVSYDEAHRKRYFQQDTDGRWYRLNNPTGKGYQDHTRDFGNGAIKPPRDRHWSVSQEQVERWRKEDRIVFTSSGYPFVKKYLDELPGRPLQSIWTDLIPPRSSRELTGFPTQKPEKLLERIIRTSSNEGDLVADFFCGSGTALVVAEKLHRHWLGCDASQTAIRIAKERLVNVPEVRKFDLVEVRRNR